MGRASPRRFVEYFTAEIRNPHTRKAHAQATGRFLAWCDTRAAWPSCSSRPSSSPPTSRSSPPRSPRASVKQHLAALRVLFDYLVVGQVLPANPAHAAQLG